MNVPEVRLTRPAMPLAPGRPFVGRVVVRNTGPEVEQYGLEPVGPLAGWTRLAEPELRIWPGEERETTVTVDLPPGSQPVAGRTSVGVAARTVDGAWAVAETPAEVAPRFELVVQAPVPHAIATTRRALVHATVVNAGNTALGTRVTARDSEGRLLHEAGRAGAEVLLGPGQALTVPVVLRTARTHWLGRPTRCDYTVQAASEPVTATANGVVTIEPILRRWWFAVLAVLVLLAIGLRGDDGWGVVVLLLLFLVILLVSVVAGRLGRLARDRTAPPPPRR